jgi:hypothetical protein
VSSSRKRKVGGGARGRCKEGGGCLDLLVETASAGLKLLDVHLDFTELWKEVEGGREEGRRKKVKKEGRKGGGTEDGKDRGGKGLVGVDGAR